ncbi:MAG: TIGR03982 family His-Xaa-Ser system protein [Sulfurovum sp.]|nr:TIGR03982 family His-Xaa-Ser system protein [Sulfurovum sp.]MCB4764138.1 TIGR03982 family His-Xaa-Ser system protein [Sulfurovum sp.]MCB4766513.1 TIGR03982 family His-Xaa-Ser system protein [Sulfurovum sp.]MCB4773280.1 TIGR03982 family His-Xaa-Ser system protein [Sulfurovum sp.]MCB4774000.1 TIGR03982 family His-Xaa-Ser system protein [Sulfurovum sp.]
MQRFFKVIVIIFAILWISKEIILPISIASLYSKDYMKLVIECDIAMEGNWYSTQENNISKEDTIQLLVCHDYDKTRKILLMSGLPEEYLSWLGLRALEIYQRPAEEYVKKHKFKVR